MELPSSDLDVVTGEIVQSDSQLVEEDGFDHENGSEPEHEGQDDASISGSDNEDNGDDSEPVSEDAGSEVESEYEPKEKPKFDPGVMKSNEESTFLQFPNLPIEIRLKVWKLSCFVTRNVDIATGTIGVTFGTEDEVGARPHYYRSRCRPPSLLHVCKESREEGLKYYKLAFGVEYKVLVGNRTMPQLTVSSPPRIYFHWAMDWLCVMLPMYIDDDPDAQVRRREEISEKCYYNDLRRLAIGINYIQSYAWPLVYCNDVLEEIIFSRA